MKKSWDVALGFYQNIKTAEKVLAKLRSEGLNRSAYIHRSHYGKISVKRSEITLPQLLTLGVFVGLFFLFLFFTPLTASFAYFIITLFAIVLGWYFFYLYRVDPSLINRFKKTVISDETLVIVQVRTEEAQKALAILRHVESGHPTSFLLRSKELDTKEVIELIKEPLTIEALSEHTRALAASLGEVGYKKNHRLSLLKNLRQCEKSLNEIRHLVAEAEFVEQTITASAEWLLDNTYVIQGNIEEVLRNLPEKFYNELPKMLTGPMQGLPRVYVIAQDLVHNTANRLNRENIIAYLNSYQAVDPLTIGELTVLPLMLRLRLIECLNALALDIERRLREGEYACFWGNRLLNVSRREPEHLQEFLTYLEHEQRNPSSHFSEELIDHLYDEDKIIPSVKQWLEANLKKDLQEIIKDEQLQKSAEQIALSNAIISLITLSQLSWRDIFEEVNPVDQILNKDPSGIYPQMDFNSRDNYRHAIELIAKGSKHSEGDIAGLALQQAEQNRDSVKGHVGYYLIDEGRDDLEKKVNFQSNWMQSIRKKMRLHPVFFYLGTILTLTLGIELFFGYLLYSWQTGLGTSAFLLLLSLIPVSELVIQLTSLIVTKILPPILLPKLAFQHEIPEELKTLVVVPALLTTEEDITNDIDQLEIHSLSNADKSLRFGIFYDFIDAPQEQMPNDQELLGIAVSGMEALEKKYGAGKFFLFCRNRVWSRSENAWIGRERKRGKIECLNHYLIQGTSPELLLKVGKKEEIQGIRYVITLDADTILPKDTARKMVATLAHPLNAPQLNTNGKVERGYTIIQPRVNTDLTQIGNTWFSQIFSDAQSANPYTQAVSDIYQDLMAQGNYHGKGIYELKTFHHILDRCFPEEHLLSHDLLEGVHVNVGFASDIVLSDLFPNDYFAWSNRWHRWMRGDWQIIDWLFPKVPCGISGKKNNPLTFISRWKIFDNLRRSLLPISSLFLLLAAFFISTSALFWASLVLLVYFTPTLCIALFNIFTNVRGLVLSGKDLLHQALRALINIALLPHQAYVSLDVLFRIFFRRLISHRKLLEWERFHYISSEERHQKFILKLYGISLFALLVFFITEFLNPSAVLAASFYCLLWFFAPVIVSLLDKPIIVELIKQLGDKDRKFLRFITRKTWRYFDDFVGPQSHWLPPDNYQAALNVEVAQRTSPTNIGLWMLAVIAANDFKYINSDEVVIRLRATFESFKKLEMFEGHFLNWYDTETLKPLFPRYVSTVDSGNLLACFWTLEQGLYQGIEEPLLPYSILNGLRDTFNVAFPVISNPISKHFLDQLQGLLNKDYTNLVELIDFIRKSLKILEEFLEKGKLELEQLYWVKQLEKEFHGWDSIAKRYYSWIDVLQSFTSFELSLIDNQAEEWRHQIYQEVVTLKMLGSTEMPPLLEQFLTILKNKSQESSLNPLYKKLNDAIQTSQWFAGEQLGLINNILFEIQELCDGLNMRFLYNKDRKLFSIGYHVDDCRLDNSYYDLLASEARIASFVAIAKDEVPLEHWWSLGRPFGYLYGRHVLLSWGGSMFEYLMPLLFKNNYPDTLLQEACQNAVACQITYAKKRGIPWGISESAFSAIDSHRIYQYRSFGVPGLGFKRDLEDDLVVSPYSTALALSINPIEAVKNFKRLASNKYNLLNDYGFFESIDFTRQHTPHGERGVVVYAYMAHHQGMSLMAFDNILNNDVMRNRFHANPRISGMESLLCERAPLFPSVARGSRKTVPISRIAPFPTAPIMGIVETPHSALPKVNLLSNGGYSVMITNSGGGYSAWKDIEFTRWRSDITSDNWGSFYYIKDIQTGDFWSAAFHPTCRRSKKYSVSFKADRTEIRRMDYQIEVNTEIVVSPEDDAEIRLLTLANLSQLEREIEITSYLELVLAPHAADAAHPCFNKMFIETESLPELSGLLGFRRLRAPDERPIYAGHVVVGNEPSIKPIQFETDRNLFIGRSKTLNNPAAMSGDLSNTQGYVLDPIFSLRYRVTLAPGQRVQISFINVISESREKTLNLMKKYDDLSSSHRAIEMAWAHAQLELRHLRIHQEEVQLFQKLASRVLYPHAQLRPSSDRLAKNKLGQAHLWPYGISGDLPIIVVTVADVHELDLVKQVLTAHVFWKMRGLRTDIVILNEESTGYEQPLNEQLHKIIQSFSSQTEIGKSGGVYLLNSDQIPEDDLILILSVARVNLVAARGSLRQQLVAPMEATTYPGRLSINPQAQEFPSGPLPFIELKYFNQLGGFSPDGREYMIFLGPNTQTPAPWINVIANADFGTLVTETGLGTTWYGNSQTNRLTPWSNDPVVNPMSDILYIRDDELGTYWTPTPGPIRELDPYRIRHGQGYSRFEHYSHGIEQDLTIFVPQDEKGGLPVRVLKLRLKNTSNVKRRLSVYNYTEWVLGLDREKTQMHVITQWDPESQAIFARNNYHPDYGNYLAFSCSIPLATSFTGNRTEFLGRNGSTVTPAALKRKKLAGLTGAAYDPCAALQVNIDLNPNEEKEVVFLLGYVKDEEAARQLIVTCRERGWAQQAYVDTIAWWDKFLGTLYVKTPDDSINFAFNRWLLYQNLSCRFWGRTAFYQSSGAYGFRDQLQDALALLYAAPQLARKQILRAAARQFEEGDVQHWWHPPSNGGVRTRISDDLLWLPFCTAQYIRVTGDASILQEEVLFIKGELLKEDQHEAYFVPEVSSETATLLEHCRRSLKKGLTEGPHGLPLIGGGDWNDGMNRVGIHGRGESVWLAWFLIHVMNDFADLLVWSGLPGSDEGFRAQAKRLAEVIEDSAWDGNWYRRAYFDDGTPLGSKENTEDVIDSLPQSWAVISGAGRKDRVDLAMKAVEEFIIKNKEKIVLLLTPPFDKAPLDPGYIKGYPPGVRENGAQYTHGSLWVPLAFSMRGENDKAVNLLRMMHPIAHTSTQEEMMHFRVEPYVLAADIYSLAGQVGRGGWTWYTGSSAWMYRIFLEETFGFKLRGEKLTIQPKLPTDWQNISLNYQYHSARYDILIENSPLLKEGHIKIELDGKVLPNNEITLANDGRVHQIKVTT